MSLQNLLKLQLIYCGTGMLFNIASIAVIANGGQQLTANDPISGMFGMSLYGLFVMTGYFKKITLYRILMIVAVIVLGYGGIVKHLFLIPESPELYSSIFIAIVGISINIFGFPLNILAALGRFKV